MYVKRTSRSNQIDAIACKQSQNLSSSISCQVEANTYPQAQPTAITQSKTMHLHLSQRCVAPPENKLPLHSYRSAARPGQARTTTKRKARGCTCRMRHSNCLSAEPVSACSIGVFGSRL